MRITGAGKGGIGASAGLSSGSLDVSGSIEISTGYGGHPTLYYTTGDSAANDEIQTVAQIKCNMYNAGADDLYSQLDFYTIAQNVPKGPVMSIRGDAQGANVGIGLTNPVLRLEVSESVNDDFVAAIRNGNAGGWGMQIQAGDGAGEYVFHCKDYDDANPLFWIRGDGTSYHLGNVGSGGTPRADARFSALALTSTVKYGLYIASSTTEQAHIYMDVLASSGITSEGALYADSDGVLYYRSNSNWAACNSAGDFSELIAPSGSALFPVTSSHKCKNYYVGEINAGDAVILNSDGYFQATVSASNFDLVGIESGERGEYRLKSGSAEREEQGQRQIGLVGFVKANVTNQGGAISVGDVLVPSNLQGHLMKSTQIESFNDWRAVAAKARESFNEATGSIEVIIGR